MASNIDPTKPLDGVPAVKSDLRGNLQAAKTEIEGLQARAQGLVVDMEEDFGVSVSNADNADQLEQLQLFLQANREKFIVIKSPVGTIDSTYNGFLTGCGRVKWDGYGTTFRCTKATGQAATIYPFLTASWQTVNAQRANYDDGSISSDINQDYGVLIDSADAGSTGVIVSTLADASDFSVGDLVVIHGFDRQPFQGAPRNPTYFEYVTVTEVDLGTGLISVNRPLKYRYDSQWPGDGVVGEPKIAKCRHTNHHWTEYLEICGVTFEVNPNNSGGDDVSVSARFVVLRDVTAPNFYGAVSQSTLYERCEMGGIEIDKIIEDFHIDKMRFNGSLSNNSSLAGGTGCQRVWITDTAFDRPLANLMPIELLSLKNCTVPALADRFNLGFIAANNYTKSLAIEDNTFVPEGEMSAAVVVSDSGYATIDSNASTTGRDIHFDANLSEVNVLAEGSLIWAPDGRGGKIIEHTGDGTDFIVRLDSPDTFTGVTEFRFLRLGEILDRGGNKVSGETEFLHQSPAILGPRNKRAERKTIKIHSSELNMNVNNINNYRRFLLMELEEFIVDVYIADTSGDQHSIDFIWNEQAANAYQRTTIRVTQEGRRVINAGGATGAQASDTLDVAPIGNWVESVTLTPRLGAGTGWASAELHEKAVFELEFTGIFL